METVWLERPGPDVPWGFRLSGGVDFKQPITVHKVTSDSIASTFLRKGDVILRIGNNPISHLTLQEAQDIVKECRNEVKLTIRSHSTGTQPSKQPPPVPQVNGDVMTMHHGMAASRGIKDTHPTNPYHAAEDFRASNERLCDSSLRNPNLSDITTSFDDITGNSPAIPAPPPPPPPLPSMKPINFQKPKRTPGPDPDDDYRHTASSQSQSAQVGQKTPFEDYVPPLSSGNGGQDYIPDRLENMMLKQGDKKPFTYTPGGPLDLNEIKDRKKNNMGPKKPKASSFQQRLLTSLNMSEPSQSELMQEKQTKSLTHHTQPSPEPAYQAYTPAYIQQLMQPPPAYETIACTTPKLTTTFQSGTNIPVYTNVYDNNYHGTVYPDYYEKPMPKAMHSGVYKLIHDIPENQPLYQSQPIGHQPDMAYQSQPTHQSSNNQRGHTTQYKQPEIEEEEHHGFGTSSPRKQSLSFKVLQWMTDTEEPVPEDKPTHGFRDPYDLRKPVKRSESFNSEDDEMRFTGVLKSESIPSKSFRILQKMISHDPEYYERIPIPGHIEQTMQPPPQQQLGIDPDGVIGNYDEASIRYRGRNIPSRSFKMLQQMTGEGSGQPTPTSQQEIHNTSRRLQHMQFDPTTLHTAPPEPSCSFAHTQPVTHHHKIAPAQQRSSHVHQQTSTLHTAPPGPSVSYRHPQPVAGRQTITKDSGTSDF